MPWCAVRSGRTIGVVDVEILVVPDCPHEAGMVALLRNALDDIGLRSVAFAVATVGSQEDADALAFGGSPSVIVNGRDLFAQPGRAASLSCRLYAGPGGLPDVRDLRQALKVAAAESAST